MSQFNYAQYQSVVNAAQNKTQNVKVGFFKLANDGDEALVRINLSDISDLQFATVHTVSTNGRWLRVSCMNEVGSYSDNCELCQAAAAGDQRIGKAGKKVYIQMMVSYKDPVTGQWSAAQPVIWERPAGFSREIANKLRDYGNLKDVLLKVTRNGKAGDMKTTYSLDYAVPAVYKPEMIPADFSAFNNFKINKHSYWEKSAEDIHAFVTTGSFPEVNNNAQQAAPAQQTYTAADAMARIDALKQANAAAQAQQPPFDGPYTQAPAQQQVQQPVEEQKPARSGNFGTSTFGGFSF